MRGKSKKPHAAVNIKCPWCKKKMDVVVHKDTVTPAVPAETELRAVVRKDGQKTMFPEDDKDRAKGKGRKVKTRKAVKGRAPKKKKGVKHLKRKGGKKPAKKGGKKKGAKKK